MTARSTSHLPSSSLGPSENVGIAPTSSWSFPLILACFLFSGFAALLYEVVWLRQFSIIFGTSEFALAVILAAYLAGLSLGAAVASRMVDRIRRPILTYAVLELVIAVTALAVPIGLKIAQVSLVFFFGGQAEPTDAGSFLQLSYIIAVSFVIIMIPTGAMGATLPLLTRHAVRHESQIGARVGLLYTINTLGAVAGILTAAFVLLPAWGMRGTTFVGVAINFAVFVLAFLAVRLSPDSNDVGHRETHVEDFSAGSLAGEKIGKADSPSMRPMLSRMVLPIIFVSGAVSFAWEIVWTRLLAHVLGGSLFAFATMLASFLTGILLGSALASRFATTRARAADSLAFCQLAIAISSLMVFHLIGPLAEWGRSLGSGEHASLWANAPLAISVLLPSTLFIGATFPFAVRLHAQSRVDAAPATARVYAWNTAGAITGALCTGLFLLPAAGFSGTALCAVGASLLLAAVIILFRENRSSLLLAAMALSIVTVLIFPPERPDSILRMSPFAGRKESGELLFSRVGRSATVYLTEFNGSYYLRTNGLPEALIPARGAVPKTSTEELLSVLPVIAVPEARSMLIIGLGGALAASAVPPSIEQVDVFELEPEVVEANKHIAVNRQNNPLNDPRINIICNDARGGLALTTKRYDIIVSQPSHPWTAGASHLYTQEFMKEVRQHLTERGVFVQWIDINFVDQSLLKSLGATLQSVFPEVQLYRPGNDSLLFLASTVPLEMERQLAATGKPLSDFRKFYQRLGIHDLNDVFVMRTFDNEGLANYCRGAMITTDDANLLATRSLRALRTLGKQRISNSLLENDSLLKPDGLRHGLSLDVPYLARLLFLTGQGKRMEALVESIESDEEYSLCKATVAFQQNDLQTCARWLRQVLAINAENQDALTLEMLVSMANGRRIEGNLLGRLHDPAAAVAEAWNYSVDKKWLEVAKLDKRLAESTPRDLGYQRAVQARVGWRIQSNQAELAAEAVQLLEGSVPLNRHPMLLRLRARAGLLAGDNAVVVGTLERLAALYRARKHKLSSDQIQKFILYSGSLLDGILAPTDALNSRIEQVRQNLDDLRR
jgi:spermidine synthase